MGRHDKSGRTTIGTFLGRLRRDVRGNTLAMMAIALIPLAAMAGSAVDTARMYVVKVRLQQACDAGVLAGRKFMTSSGSTTLDTTAQQRARDFFDNNFDKNWMKVSDVQFTPTKTADQQVSGVAKATVPMSLMKMFQMNDVPLEVTCEARFDVADADIMMVLDTTGSMACAAADTSGCSQGSGSYTRPDGTTGYYVPEKSNSKLKALRQAVLDFYDTVDGNKDPTTHIRYGFVTYTSTVNAGGAIPSQYMLNTTWNYQSRRSVGDSDYGSPTSSTSVNSTAGNCAVGSVRTPATGWDANGEAKINRVTFGEGKCTTVKGQTLLPIWRFQQWPANVAGYVASLGSGQAVQDPSKAKTSLTKWQGCIEEVNTTPQSSYNVNSLPDDIDPDHIPTSDADKWRPMWPDQIYNRTGTVQYGITDVPGWRFPPYASGGINNGNWYSLWANTGGDPEYLDGGYVSCGKPVNRLEEMSRSDVSDYVNATDFRALGGTYHDTGMIWGARMLSPKGVFANDTAAWPGRNTPNRHIVFMTDGDMAPNPDIYGMYGIERHDQRVGGGTTDIATLTDLHNKRFLAACEAAKARNMTVWVVAFGSALNAQLSGCATQPANQHAFFAANDQQLKDAFKTIAAQVAMLRVSK